ncbi:hypothetical protein A5886_000572 [Enterococcus sp. 8G7_MSG3316]|uniref:Uncharacterized protein n=1 Tax=Candidatus Enterococcus testudinis TaxID=1834191 RepID=A0A242A3H5_9ENTE|nr:DUF916 and DUF3324 domain-containing protein [Enterococcus sp. 8G7_MSG3316]OTN75502.1 hypothetical protein A5886_000572 [Enterococcus sp. 8G7_MSG3316]
MVFAIAMVLFIMQPKVGLAEESGLDFYVTPVFSDHQVEGSLSYFDLNMPAGESDMLQLTIQNASSEPIQVQVTPHTAYTNVHGVVEYGKDAEEPDTKLTYALDTLIETSEVITLAGNETKEIEVPIHMPEASFEGFLAGGLRIAEVKEEAEDEVKDVEGVAINNEFAYVIGVVVSNSRDSIQPDLELLDVFADQLNYRNVISATIQNYTPTFVNRLAVDATIQKVGDTEILYAASAEQMQMAPNSHFRFPISLEGDRFQSGDYLLTLNATSGEEEWSWEQTFTIEADEARGLNRQDVTIDSSLNWWMVGSIILFTLLMLLSVYLLIKNRQEKQVKE